MAYASWVAPNKTTGSGNDTVSWTGTTPYTGRNSRTTTKVKGYESGMSTTASTCTIVNGSQAIANTTSSTAFGTSVKTITVPNGSLSWANIKNYGSNFGVRVIVKRNKNNTRAYLYIYGAELEVTYTL